MSMIRYTVLLLFLVGLLMGCDTTVQPPIPEPPDSLEVYSAVQAGDSSQYAFVAEPRAADQSSIQYVQDARVQVAGHSLRVVPDSLLFPGTIEPATPPGESNANYVTDSLVIQAGETVQLRVSTEAHEVTGTVQVPGSFTGTVDSMTVHWRPSAGAQQYEVKVQRFDDRGEVEWEYRTTTSDTMTTISNESDNYSGTFQPGPHGVFITAVDTNLANYQDRDARRAGIEGGYGFFGAITRIGGAVTLPATDEKKRTNEAPLLHSPGDSGHDRF